MIDPRCSLDVRESGARLGFVHESTMGVDELLVKLKCRIPVVRKTARPFCKGASLYGTPSIFMPRKSEIIVLPAGAFI